MDKKTEKKRQEFLSYVRSITWWCGKYHDDKQTALEVLAHSILVALDGGSQSYRPPHTYLGGSLHEDFYKETVPREEGAMIAESDLEKATEMLALLEDAHNTLETARKMIDAVNPGITQRISWDITLTSSARSFESLMSQIRHRIGETRD